MSVRDTPEVRQTRGSPEPVPGRCGAKLIRTDPPRYCTQHPARGGTGRCARFHNGSPKHGFDLPQTKTGERSKYAYMSPKVFEAFDNAMADQALLDLKPDIALLEVLKQDAARGLALGESVEGWKMVREARDLLQLARTPAQLRAGMQKLTEAIDGSEAAAIAREETAKQIERRGKLVTRYQQLQIEAEDLIPAKRVGLVMALMASLVREFIPDAERRAEFSRRFVGLLGPRLRSGSRPATIDVAGQRP